MKYKMTFEVDDDYIVADILYMLNDEEGLISAMNDFGNDTARFLNSYANQANINFKFSNIEIVENEKITDTDEGEFKNEIQDDV